MNRYQPKKCKNPVKAIHEHCIECMGGRRNGGYLKQISECGSPDCALFEFRFGKNPYHIQNLTAKQRNERADRLEETLSHEERSKKVPKFGLN
jgi:hypothetical protein